MDVERLCGLHEVEAAAVPLLDGEQDFVPVPGGENRPEQGFLQLGAGLVGEAVGEGFKGSVADGEAGRPAQAAAQDAHRKAGLFVGKAQGFERSGGRADADPETDTRRDGFGFQRAELCKIVF